MLDLNLDTFSGAGSHRDTGDITAPAKGKKLKEDSRTVTDEDSGTSCSSVIIAGEETTSAAGGGFISFDILKRKGQESPQKEGNNPSTPEYSTFMATGEEGFSSFASGEGQKWLKLSSPLCTSEVVKFGRSNNNNKNKNKNNNNNNNNSHRSIRKSRRGPRSRSSPYRGVTFYRRTGRWESHIWDCGKQVYLGGFDSAHSAARAYDRAALKFRGLDADINFQASDYEEEMKLMRNLTKEEFVQLLRRQTNAGGGSRYRGGGGGGGGGLYKSGMPLETRTSQLFTENKICNIRDNNTPRDVTISGFQTNMCGVKTAFGSNNGEDKGQNLELSLELSPSASREGKFPERVESNRDLRSYTMTFAVKQNPVGFSRIYPHHHSINHELGIAEKKMEEIAPYNEMPSNRSWRSIQGNNNNNLVFDGVCAASSRFSLSSNSSSSTGPADSSSSLDLSLKPSNSSNLLGDIASLSSSTTRNIGSYYIS